MRGPFSLRHAIVQRTLPSILEKGKLLVMATQKRTHIIVVLVIAIICSVLLYFSIRARSHRASTSGSAPLGSRLSDPCPAEDDISENIAKLTRQDDEINEAAKKLLALAGTSTTCRSKTVQGLVAALQDHLDLRGESSLRGTEYRGQACDFAILQLFHPCNVYLTGQQNLSFQYQR